MQYVGSNGIGFREAQEAPEGNIGRRQGKGNIGMMRYEQWKLTRKRQRVEEVNIIPETTRNAMLTLNKCGNCMGFVSKGS